MLQIGVFFDLFTLGAVTASAIQFQVRGDSRLCRQFLLQQCQSM
jgi:hypothetical protein